MGGFVSGCGNGSYQVHRFASTVCKSTQFERSNFAFCGWDSIWRWTRVAPSPSASSRAMQCGARRCYRYMDLKIYLNTDIPNFLPLIRSPLEITLISLTCVLNCAFILKFGVSEHFVLFCLFGLGATHLCPALCRRSFVFFCENLHPMLSQPSLVAHMFYRQVSPPQKAQTHKKTKSFFVYCYIGFCLIILWVHTTS